MYVLTQQYIAAISDHPFLTDPYTYEFSVFPGGSHDIYAFSTLFSSTERKNV